MRKKSQQPSRALKDTRGLTADQDPRMFYVYSSQKRQQQADGLEGLLYKLIPLVVFAFTAYAVDPFAQLKVGVGRVTPANRYRERSSSNILNVSKRYVTGVFNDNGELSEEDAEYLVGTQEGLLQQSLDTTRKSRLPGSDQGELELRSVYIDSPGRKLILRDLLDLTDDGV